MNATQTEWFLARNKKQFGPLTLDQIKSGLASGRVLATDLIWNQDMENWQEVRSIGELNLVYKKTEIEKKTPEKEKIEGINNDKKNNECEKTKNLETKQDFVLKAKNFHNSMSLKKKILVYGGSAILILGLIGAAGDKKNEVQNSVGDNSVSNNSVKKKTGNIFGGLFSGNINMEKFRQIQTGMTVNQVNEIANKKGELFSEANMFGRNHSTYTWSNKDGSNMTLSFENGRVSSKVQFGLK